MNYYERHLGDYARDTGHLSVLEHGVYTLLLDRYYATERPLPLDPAECYRLARAQSKQERAAVDWVLMEFFQRVDDGFHQPRVDEEIARFRDGAPERTLRHANEQSRLRRHREERARLFKTITEAGMYAAWNASIETLRGLAQRVAETETATPHVTHETPAATAPATPATATRPQTPDTRHQEQKLEPQGASPDGEAPTRADPIPYQAIAEAYNRELTRLPKVQTLTPKRKTLMRRAWQADPRFRSLGFWADYFAACEADPFRNGTGRYGNGHANWRPTLDYLLRPDVVVQLVERVASPGVAP